jgi:hypothetical protein
MLVASGNRRNVYEDHPHIKHDSALAASPTGGRLGDRAMAMAGARTSRSKIQRARYLGSSSLISSRLLIAALDERSYNGLAIPGTRGFHRNADRSRCLPGRLPVTDAAARHFRQQFGEDGQGRDYRPIFESRSTASVVPGVSASPGTCGGCAGGRENGQGRRSTALGTNVPRIRADGRMRRYAGRVTLASWGTGAA